MTEEAKHPVYGNRKPYTLGRVLRHTFSGVDNVTIDIGRVLWFVGATSYILISFIYVYKTGNWNAMEWGAGYAAVNGGAGIALKLKEKTEPTE